MEIWIKSKSCFIFFLLFLLPLIGQGANNVDRMISNLPLIQDLNDKVDTLNEIAWVLRRKVDDPRGQQYAKEANEIALAQNYIQGLGDSYVRLGLIYYYQGKFSLAIDSYKKALDIRLGLNNISGSANLYLNLGNCYHENLQPDEAIAQLKKGVQLLDDKKDYPAIRAKLYNSLGISYTETGLMDSATLFINKSLDIRKKRNDRRSLPKALIELGTVYRYQSLYDNALNALHEALKYAVLNKDSVNLSRSYMGIGNVFLDAENLDSSLIYYNKAFEICTAIDWKKGLGVFHNNIGKLFLKTKSYKKSNEHLKEALKLRTTLNDTSGMALTENLLGDLNLAINEPEKAIIHFENSYSLTDEIKTPINAIELYQGMADAYILMGKYEEAAEKLTKSIKSKAQLESSFQKANDLQLNLAMEKILVAQRKQLEEKSFRNKVITGALILLSIFIYISFQYRNQLRKREDERVIAQGKQLVAEQNQLLAEQEVDELMAKIELRANYARMKGEEEERLRVSKQLHDQVGSMLTTVKLLLSAFGKNLPDLSEKKVQQYKEANDVLGEASEEVRLISHNLHSGKIAELGLVKQIEEMARRIQAAGTINIQVNTYKMLDRLDLNKEITIYRIIRELVGNVLKHAKAKNLTIQLNRLKDTLNIIIEDDGKGFNRQKLDEKKSGIGLKNAYQEVKSMDGVLNIDSGKGAGTSISIDIPINKPIVEKTS